MSGSVAGQFSAMETDDASHLPSGGTLKRSSSAPMIVEAVNMASTSSLRFPSLAALDLAPPATYRRRAATYSGSSLPTSPSLVRYPSCIVAAMSEMSSASSRLVTAARTSSQ